MNRTILRYRNNIPQQGGQCTHHCPGGNRCNCNQRIDHSLHICHDKDCPCHSRERYEGGSHGQGQ